MISIQPLTLSLFTDRLRHRQPFTFVRYGDGEWNAIFKVRGQNCDGHKYFDDLGDALARTLTEPRGGAYFYSIGPKAAKGMQSQVTRWLAAHTSPTIQWHDSEVLLTASLRGALYPLVKMLNHRRVVVVGASHLARLWEPVNGGRGLLREPQAHVITPTVNAWLDRKRIAQDILLAAHPTNPNSRADVVLFSAGMLSKVLIWQISETLGKTISLWDTGSLFDLYCGVDSRSYARRMPMERKIELVRLNFDVTREFAAASLRGSRAETAGMVTHA